MKRRYSTTPATAQQQEAPTPVAMNAGDPRRTLFTPAQLATRVSALRANLAQGAPQQQQMAGFPTLTQPFAAYRGGREKPLLQTQYTTTRMVKHVIVRRLDVRRVCGGMAAVALAVSITGLLLGPVWAIAFGAGLFAATSGIFLLLHLTHRSEFICDN